MGFRRHRKLLPCNFNFVCRQKIALFLLIASIIIVLYGFRQLQQSNERDFIVYNGINCMPIDVVYTWVNGSDPAFIDSAKRFDADYDPVRFDDKNELRYSLRSLERYANWIGHVYIVTNGQIPNWLDLSYDRVTVVPHEVLVPHSSQLPTFSSAAIETFLHRIPKLSKRFLYLNDDIFLGAPLYPEDLYTESEGVRIYQAWMVPDCATDCPWTYIGDGACDRHCNIVECQFDGGDCSEAVVGDGTSQSEENEEKSTVPPTFMPIRTFPKHKLLKKMRRNATSFKEIMRRKNLTTLTELRQVVDNFNKHKLNLQSEPDVLVSTTMRIRTPEAQLRPKDTYKSSTDIYSHSLINTNMLLNSVYGFKPRNVVAHVGFLLDRNIIDEMQEKFKKEVNATAHQRFRAPTDLQFAFAYYSFLMSETISLSLSQIFDEFDTDNSHTWSDREVRTLLARIYPPPLDWSAMHFFEQVVNNCSQEQGLDKRESEVLYSTLVYERYEDSNLPTITRDLVMNCPMLADALISNFGQRPKHKYNVNSKRNTHSNFMMLTSNVTVVVDSLDKLRRNPKKFNCINDNLDLSMRNVEDNELIRHLLEDFYLSFFPRPSKFELEPQFRNRFTSWHDYQRWRRRKRAALVIGYGFTILISILLIRFLCVHKAKFVRRCIQKL